jgi:RHS repeat-associated protein
VKGALLQAGNPGGGALSTQPAFCHSSDPDTYTLKQKDGEVWTFTQFPNATQVKLRAGTGCLYFLTRKQDPQGRWTQITRNDQSIITAIQTSSGQSVTMTLSNGVIASITDNLGRSVSYGYEDAPYFTLRPQGGLGAGGGGAGGGTGTGLNDLIPVFGQRLNAATTPEGTSQFSYQQDPREVPLKGAASGAQGTGSLELKPSASVCDVRRGGTLIVSAQLPGFAGPFVNHYGNSKRVLRQSQPDGRELTFSYSIAGGCVTSPGVLDRQCSGPSCQSIDSEASEAQGWVVTGGSIAQMSITDPNGNHYDQRFNGARLATQEKLADGQVMQYERDANNNITAVTDPIGRVTRMSYDERGNRTQSVDPLGRVTSITYDGKWNRPTSIVRQLNDGTPILYQYQYDAFTGVLTAGTDPEGNVTLYTYDANHRLSAISDPLGHTTTIAYDANGNPTQITDALGNSVQMVTDAGGRVTQTTDALGYSTNAQYDALNRLRVTTDPLNQTTRLDYDARNNLISVTNELNVPVESYGYDSLNRLVARTDAKGKSETYAYDPAGNLTQIADRNGRTIDTTYDARNRPISITYADGSSQTHSYDAAGRMTELVERLADGTTVTQRLTYDDVDRVTRSVSETATLRTDIAYGYDALDRLTQRTVSVTALASAAAPLQVEQTSYAYDRASRIVKITTHALSGGPTPAGLQTVSYTWDAASRLTQKTLPNGISQGFVYDDANRLTRIQYARADGTVIQSIDYSYDANGQRTTKRNDIATQQETPFNAAYDLANRLTQITLSPGSTQPKTYTLSYDDNGNLVAKQNQGDATDKTTYTWDARDRLVSLQGPGMVATFSYDALGRRLSKTINGQRIEYVYDGVQAIGELLADASGKLMLSATQLTGLAIDEVLARYAASGNTVYLTDALGSVIAQARDDQGLQSFYAYSPYGETQLLGNDNGNASQYTARENDGTGLYYYRARYYDPVLKRFVAEDPIGIAGGPNLYAYVDGNPISLVDPAGNLDSLPQGIVDFSAGFGDTLSFGLTDLIRDQMGTNGAVNRCSGAYQGGEVGGVALGLAFGAATLGRHALANGTRSILRETRSFRTVSGRWHRMWGSAEHLDHMFIPQQWASVNAGWNIVPLSPWVNSVLLNPSNFLWNSYTRVIPYLARGLAQFGVAGMYGALPTAGLRNADGDCSCR